MELNRIHKFDEDSNYEKVKETWRQKFLEMDQEALIRNFEMEADENFLYVIYYSHRMAIDRNTGVIRYAEDPEKTVDFGPAMAIYNSFHYAQDGAKASGKLIPFREVKRVYPFEAAYKKTTLKEFADAFSGHVEELKAACEKLGGIEMPQGDAGYILPVFPFLTIAVLFWDGDDEFEAQGNILFDSNITDFMHEENVVMVADDAIRYLKEEAGL